MKRTGPRMKLMKVITQIKKKDTQSNTPPYSPIGSLSSMSISLLDDDMSPSIMDSVLPLMRYVSMNCNTAYALFRLENVDNIF